MKPSPHVITRLLTVSYHSSQTLQASMQRLVKQSSPPPSAQRNLLSYHENRISSYSLWEDSRCQKSCLIQPSRMFTPKYYSEHLGYRPADAAPSKSKLFTMSSPLSSSNHIVSIMKPSTKSDSRPHIFEEFYEPVNSQLVYGEQLK